MKPEIKQRWVAALRSGNYQQGQSALKSNGKFCCLGVLTDLHLKEVGKYWEDLSEDKRYTYSQKGWLAEETRVWAGLDYVDPHIGDSCATTLNDNLRLSFRQIAEQIEKHL